MGVMKRNASEQELSCCDNERLCYAYADLCPNCGMYPRMLPVYRDTGEKREHAGYVVECAFCGSSVMLFSKTRRGALRVWNKLSDLEK